MRFNLTLKISFVIIIISIIMLSIMVFSGFKFSKDMVKLQTSEIIQSKYTNVMSQIDLLMTNYLVQVNIISTDQLLSQAILENKNYELISKIKTKLNDLLIYSGPWDDLIILNENNSLVTFSSIKSNDTPVVYMEELSAISRANLERSSYTDIFEADGKEVLSCISSIKANVKGKDVIIGYVVGRIAIRSIEDILNNSSRNNMLLRSDGHVVIKNISKEMEQVFVDASASNFSGYSSSKISDISGIPYIINYTKERGVPGYQGNNWLIVNVSDVSTMIKNGENNINKIIYIAGFFLILISVIIIFFLRKVIIKPVTELKVISAAMASGDFDKKIKINSSDEIGELSTSFNEMAAQLKEMYSSFEHKIKEKTSELNSKINELEKNKIISEKALHAIEVSEEKMIEKNKQVEGAFSEVQHFARIADKERLTYSLLISSIGEAVIVMNPNGEISVTNSVCSQMLGLDIKNIEGAYMYSIFELFTNDGKKVDIIELGKILAEGKLHSFRYWSLIRLNDGFKFTISGVIAPLIDNRSGGIIRGMIFTFRDVVSEKLLDDARIGFVSTASHQLRTPLTSMKWFAEMLRDGDAGEITEDQQHFLERISEGIDRMVGLVNMLLQIARVEAGRTAIEATPIKLSDIVDGVVKSLEVDLKLHNQHVNINSNPENFPTISLDKDYIWQIVQNLLTNAERYSFDNANIDVNITIEGDFAILSVKDYGIGIPESAKARLFEKFYRADNALAKVPSGTGLGLSLIKMLVDEMGGDLSFESREGVGTTFYIKIPLAGMNSRGGEVKLSI